MPLYNFICSGCGKALEVLAPMDAPPPECCGRVMTRLFTGKVLIKEKYPLWVDRIEDIHKAQEQRGEKLRFVHPKEVRAT